MNVWCEIYTKPISHLAPSLSMTYNEGRYDALIKDMVNIFLHLKESIYCDNFHPLWYFNLILDFQNFYKNL